MRSLLALLLDLFTEAIVGGSVSYTPTMLFLSAGWDVLGLTVVTGDTWVNQEAAHILRFLEVANISSIDVYKGAVYPLINTENRYNAWASLYGGLAFAGAYLPEVNYTRCREVITNFQ